MNIISVSEIKQLLAEHGASPTKYLGQNFLINPSVLHHIIEASDITPEDTVLEIGPGLGVLTRALAQKAKRVIAVEKDRSMVKILEDTLKDFKNAEVICQDALLYQNNLTNYKIVANIPYYLTSALIRKFLEEKEKPLSIVLLIQKEVAQRICEKPPRLSLLGTSVQFYAIPKIITHVSKESFWPAPSIDSSVIKITPITRNDAPASEDFFTVVKAGFSHPRKQLVNNLCILKSKNGVTLDKYTVSSWLLQNHIAPESRAQTLSIEQWILLTKTFPNL